LNILLYTMLTKTASRGANLSFLLVCTIALLHLAKKECY
jgi:hypothetical protein